MKKIVAIVCVLLCASSGLVLADTYIKTKTHTDPVTIMGQAQPAKDDITEQWLGKSMLCVITGSQSTIVDNVRKVLVFVNHSDKTYVETPLPLDISKLIPPEAAPMLNMMKVTIKVAPTAETRKVANYTCQGYDVDWNMAMMPMKMKAWASTGVPFDWSTYSSMNENVSKLGMIDDASMAELRKIKGVQLAHEMTGNLMGAAMKITSEVVEISEKPAPAGVYSVPAGYTKKPSLSITDLQKKK